jgi:hypothetical protein
MKKFIGTLAVLCMAGSVSFASSARVEALGSSVHLVDAVTIFGNPTDANQIPDAALIEYGPKDTLGSAAKGGFLKSMDTAKLGFFLGVGSASRGNVTIGTASVPFEGAENPFAVVYAGKAGDMGYGVAFNYSSSAKKNKVAGTAVSGLDSATQSAMGLTGSVVMGEMNFGLNLGLGDTAKTAFTSGDSVSYAGTSTGLFGYYSMDTMTFGLHYGMTGTKIDSTISGTKASVKDEATNTMQLHAVNTVKKEGAEFFYGVTYKSEATTTKSSGTSSTGTTTSLPVVLGVEADASSWLVLRGSVTQNVLLGSTKPAGGSADTISHNTTVNAGMGLKFNKSILDMTLTAAGNGTVAANAVGAKAAYTYLF